VRSFFDQTFVPLAILVTLGFLTALALVFVATPTVQHALDGKLPWTLYTLVFIALVWPVWQHADKAFWVFLGLTLASVFATIAFVFFRAPAAQLSAGGIAQKIFYFHVPAATALYLSGVTGCIAAGLYLYRPTDVRDAVARAGAECAVIFGALVLTSGPLWAKKAWGVYWTWDPRLTTLMLTVLLYGAVMVIRAFAGSGDAERRFAAAFTVMATVLLPIVHYSVQKWGGIHPTVVSKGGGGLHHPDMRIALWLGMFSMTFLTRVLIWTRARLALAVNRLSAVEEVAAARGMGAAS